MISLVEHAIASTCNYIPNIDDTLGVANKHPTVVVKSQAVGVNMGDHCFFPMDLLAY